MATYTPDINQTMRPWGTSNRIYMLENTIDFSDTEIGSGAGAVQNDLIEALAIPSNTIVLIAGFKVITAETDATDLDLGVTGGTADGFVDGASFATTGLKIDLDEAYNTAVMGLFFSSADTIDIKVTGNHTVNSAVVKVFALCIDLSEI
jgi:hypothetical protein